MPTLVDIARDEVARAAERFVAQNERESEDAFNAALSKFERVVRTGGHRYLVKLRGRHVGAFTYARDAQAYIDSEHARHKFDTGDERGVIDLYPQADYSMEDVDSGRPVVGLSGHGNAILGLLG